VSGSRPCLASPSKYVTYNLSFGRPYTRVSKSQAMVKAPSYCQLLHDSYSTTYLEVVAERPVSQHFEEGVVVCVLSNVIEVCRQPVFWRHK